MKSLAKVEKTSIKETKEKLSKLPKEKKKPKRPKTANAGTDSQPDFIKSIQEKLEEDYSRKLDMKEREIRKLDVQLEKLKMTDEGLDEYQAERVRALTQIMQEVIRDDYKPDKKSIAKLFGIDKLILNGKFKCFNSLIQI